ncbi:OLC1v1002056C1 [Oldenlandia corymbosa var. corymbosa]|uniref:OLC1v1002056C1 n=1 Tax=Oldenlandia corymbosa var. corymbosa TaxID=529605 RepID=A0AAV1D7F3_OLDCO|nr:OLC1v1002056C1 [Oldenlandia corymbosa var. corymbosa]
MGSLGSEVAKKKAMWLYPKVAGFCPSERWGHSACYSSGSVYIFGGCCGGMHFSDVLVLNLERMDWSILMTKGQGPGPRDSHSAVIVENRMIVFGGTNGSEKVNDVHILDLRSREWTRPECKGTPPSPRESHSATLVGNEKLVIFGGSGEGEANYLNDLHVLDLKTMSWASPETQGNVPVPRDSHCAVAIGSRLFLYGGDSGDRYQGDVDVLDIETLAWSRMDVHGPLPDVRAGHASVNFGTKVYVIGGVAHKKYYNDVWVLDVLSCSWTRLDICGRQPQGRFSHTAVATNFDITIYGGCGEDERPLNELLTLQLGVEQNNGLYKMPLHLATGNQCNVETTRSQRVSNNLKEREFISLSESFMGRDSEERIALPKRSFSLDSDAFHLKRRRVNNSKIFHAESGATEEHSVSLSPNSSPSQSDQGQTTVNKVPNVQVPKVFPILKQHNAIPVNIQPSSKIMSPRIEPDRHFFTEHPTQSKPVNLRTVNHDEVHFPETEARSLGTGQFHSMIGTEVRGKVDGAFDSGYLMTATVNGKTFRGVLFAPGPMVMTREVNLGYQRPPTRTNHTMVNQVNTCINHSNLGVRLPNQPTKLHSPEFQLAQFRRSNSAIRSSASSNADPNHKNELLGVVLSLGGPGYGNGKL